MEVTLKPNNRKATIISGISDDLVKVRVEDGRELVWPISKINMPPKEGEDTLKMVVIPAIDRLEELKNDVKRLKAVDIDLGAGPTYEAYTKVLSKLSDEAIKEFTNKWGL